MVKLMFKGNKLSVILFLISCFNLRDNLLYSNNDSTRTYDRIKIAILPPQIIFDNRTLRLLKIEDIEKTHIISYQKTLESELILTLNEFKYIENILNSNQVLKDSGIHNKHIWTYPLEELARILNSDIVYYLKVKQKNPFNNFDYYSLYFPDLFQKSNVYAPININSELISKSRLIGELFVYSKNNNKTYQVETSIKVYSKKTTEENIRALISNLIKQLNSNSHWLQQSVF
jgi:hypothetical protein